MKKHQMLQESTKHNTSRKALDPEKHFLNSNREIRLKKKSQAEKTYF